MAFPTTLMSGYTELRGRIELSLGRCQEQPSLEFKTSCAWDDLKWRLLKAIMGLGNQRDGGMIVIGVAEVDDHWELTGIDPDHLKTFDYDDIKDQLAKYASPTVVIDIVTHQTDDGKRYLVIHVHQFSDTPIVCRNNFPDTLKPKDRLQAGDVCVRPNVGKPQTVVVTSAEQMHDLLEMAAEARARRMLEVGKRIGMVPGQTSTALYDDELAS